MINAAVLALRSVLFYLGYFLGTIVLATLSIVLGWFVPRHRRYRFHLIWCQFMLTWFRWTVGVRYDIRGLEHLPGRPVVVLANHQSEWETIFLYAILAPVCPILKQELLRIPIWGWAMRMTEPIAINRSKRHEASKSILTQGVARLKQGMTVVIFPEGTRVPAGSIKGFSRGGAKLAMAAQVPILPVAHNAGHCWPPRRFLKFPGTVQLVIGEAIDTQGRTALALTEEVEGWIRKQGLNDAA